MPVHIVRKSYTYQLCILGPFFWEGRADNGCLLAALRLVLYKQESNLITGTWHTYIVTMHLFMASFHCDFGMGWLWWKKLHKTQTYWGTVCVYEIIINGLLEGRCQTCRLSMSMPKKVMLWLSFVKFDPATILQGPKVEWLIACVMDRSKLCSSRKLKLYSYCHLPGPASWTPSPIGVP